METKDSDRIVIDVGGLDPFDDEHKKHNFGKLKLNRLYPEDEYRGGRVTARMQRQIYTGITRDESVVYVDEGNREKSVLVDSHGDDYFRHLGLLVQFSKRKRAMEIPTVAGRFGLLSVAAGKKRDELNAVGHLLHDCSQSYIHEPCLQVLYDLAHKKGFVVGGEPTGKVFLFNQPLTKGGIEEVKSFLRDLHEIYRSDVYREKVYKISYGAYRNERSNRTYVDTVFHLHNRCRVVRVDLGYQHPDGSCVDGVYPDHDPYKTLNVDNVFDDRKKFQNSARGGVFQDCVGCITKLEFTSKRGYHFHFMFFFMEGSRYSYAETVSEIVSKWFHVAHVPGAFHDCKYDRNKFKRIGIGMISHDDIVALKDIYTALFYLAQKDRCLRVKTTIGRKIFTRSPLVTRKRPKTVPSDRPSRGSSGTASHNERGHRQGQIERSLGAVFSSNRRKKSCVSRGPGKEKEFQFGATDISLLYEKHRFEMMREIRVHGLLNRMDEKFLSRNSIPIPFCPLLQEPKVFGDPDADLASEPHGESVGDEG